MGRISIDLDSVNEQNAILSRKLAEIENAITAMNSLRNRLSGDVLGRYGIREQISSIIQSIYAVETSITNIIQTTSAAATRYRDVDYALYCLFMDITAFNEPSANALAFDHKPEEPFFLRLLEMYDSGSIPLNVLLDLMNNEDEMIQAIKLYNSGVKFTSDILSDGKRYLYFDNINQLTHAQVGDLLKDLIGGSENWSDYKIRNFMNRGVDIYSANGSGTRNLNNYFSNITYENLSKYVTNMSLPKGSQFVQEFTKNFKDGVVGDFNYSNWSTLSKTGKTLKVLGTASTVITIGSDFIENTYIDGEWQFTPKTIVNATTDATIDVASTAGAMAAGAAIGSFIVPPIGTVAGFAAGALIDFGINYEFADFDGDGQEDSLVDGAKILVDNAVDGIFDLADDVGGMIGDLFW